MAEYAISAVRYSEDRSTICRVRAHEVRPGSVGPPLEITREHLLAAVRRGMRFLAIRTDARGRYSAPAPVRLVEVGGRTYLRCDARAGSSDCLEGIEDF